MIFYAVICTDPADSGSQCWAHGAYATKEQAQRVVRRLKDDTTWTVRWNKVRVQPPPDIERARRAQKATR